MAIHRRLDSFSLIFYLLLILWVKTELRQSLPPITSGFQLLRSLSANKYFCRTSRAAKTLYLSWFSLVDPMRLSSKEQNFCKKISLSESEAIIASDSERLLPIVYFLRTNSEYNYIPLILPFQKTRIRIRNI